MNINTYEIDGYLNNYGFCVKKKNIPSEINIILDNYFSVKPELNYENEKIKDSEKYFKVYYQDDKYIVLPKFSTNIIIDISKYIKLINKDNSKTIRINNIEYSKISFKIIKYKYKNELSKFNFNGKLRDYQQVIIDEIFKKFGLDIIKSIKNDTSQFYPKGGLIKLSCGGGKCLGINTPVMMYDGTIKMVQDIVIGDKLMGDDSKPRNVIKLARGKEQMYKIIQESGDAYIVNSSHILSLYDPKKNKVVDIGIQDYLNLKNILCVQDGITINRFIEKKYTIKGGLYGFKSKVSFEPKKITLDPYLVGLILGKKFNNIEKNNSELSMFIEKYDLINNPHIPHEYKTNTAKIQLEVLAGIIDSIGTYNTLINQIEIPNISKKLSNDIIFICMSYGLNHCVFETFSSFKIILYGKKIYDLPIKSDDKNPLNIDLNFKDDIESEFDKTNIYEYYKINVIPLDVDDYYGFEIDGNKRFLLGDFTVTHNTMLAIYISWALGLKTLVVTHKEFLMDQWEERITNFTDAKVGRIRQNVIDVENKDIVIGMLRSLSIREYPTEILQQFGLVIYDEVHHTGSRVESQALLHTSAQYTIGLSATPDRADGMTKIINWHVGDILYEMEKKYNYRVLVKKIFFRSNDPLFKEKKTWFQHRFAPNHVTMTENITKIKTRNLLIVNMIDVLKSMGRKILVLSYRVEHLELLKKMVDDKIKLDGETHIYNSYFYMGKTKRGEKKLAEKDGHIIFATMQLAEEGLDIQHLDTVIFALPVSIQKDKKNKKKIKSSKALIQSIGRILRNDKLEELTQIPLVIDISDMFSIYSSWSNKRNEIYGKKNWYMQNYYWEDLEFLNSTSVLTQEKDKNKKIKSINIMFNDILDEDFIEKNLMISDEEANKLSLQDKQDEIDELNENLSSSSLSDKSNNSNKFNNCNSRVHMQKKIEDEVKPIKYGFGKK